MEEFKRKKQEALAKKGSSLTTSPTKPADGGAGSCSSNGGATLADLPPGLPLRPAASSSDGGHVAAAQAAPPTAPKPEATAEAAAAAAPAPAAAAEAESLRQQVGQLLESMDGLHRALQDERLNSSQLEGQLAEQQARLRELHDANAQLQAAAAAAEAAPAVVAPGEGAQQQHQELQLELAETRAQAERYAHAAENLSAELAAARQEQEAAAAEAAAAQEQGYSQIADYKYQLDLLREQLEGQAGQLEEQAQRLEVAAAGSQRAEEQLVALSTQLAQQQEETELVQVRCTGTAQG